MAIHMARPVIVTGTVVMKNSQIFGDTVNFPGLPPFPGAKSKKFMPKNPWVSQRDREQIVGVAPTAMNAPGRKTNVRRETMFVSSLPSL
jgi:hypothetical protein